MNLNKNISLPKKSDSIKGLGVLKPGQKLNFSLSNNEKIALIGNISTMLKAGIPILETVDSLLEDSKGNQKKLLEVLRADLMQGQQIHTTFEKFPRIFDRVTVNLIAAAEEAGTLDVSLNDLREKIQRDSEFGDKLKSAMIYPMFILGVFFATILMILIVVIPKISQVFSQLNTPLPLPTRVLIFMSNILLTYTVWVVACLIVLIVLVIFIFKRYKLFITREFMKLPVISKLALEIDMARFSRSMFLLLSAGLPITTTLELVQDVVVRKDVIKAVTHTKQVVYAGKKFSEGLKDSKGIVPPTLMKIIEAGEHSGSLDKAMQDCAEYMDYQVAGSIKAVTSLIEPVMIVVIGILIGGMMLSIIAPIYSMIGSISPHS